MSELIQVPRQQPWQAPQRVPMGPTPAEVLPSEDEPALRLGDVIAVLRRHRWLVLGITAVVLAATAFVVLRQPPLYRAEAVIRLKDQQRALVGDLAGNVAQQVVGRGSDPILSQLQVLQSRGVAAKVLERTGLRLQPYDVGFNPALLSNVRVAGVGGLDTLTLRFDRSSYTGERAGTRARAAYGRPLVLPGITLTILRRPQVPVVRFAVLPEPRAADQLWGSLSTTPRQQTDVVDVTYTSRHPELAATVVNAALDAFQEVSAERSRQEASRRRMFIEEQLERTDGQLMQTQLALTDFRRREQVYSSAEKFAAQQSGMMELEVRRQEMDADRRMYEQLLAGLRQSRPGQASRLQALVSSPGVAENPVITGLYQQLMEYEATRDSLTAGAWGSASSNPDVQRLDQLITNTRSRLVDAAGSHVAALQARIAALDDLRGRNAAQMQALPASEAEEVRLVQQVEMVQKVADQLREEYQKARIAEAVEVGQVDVVDRAVLPLEPIGSGKGLKLALGLVLGLMLGSGAAFLREHMDTAIRHQEDVEGALRVPGLAVIPRIARRQGQRRRLALPGRMDRNGAAKPEEMKDGEYFPDLVTLHHPRTPGAEAFRTLRTNLIFSQATGEMKRLVITSTGPSEGKTTTASNLAVAFAQQGMRVLIVDCDLRKPRLHSAFHLPKEPGLTQLMLRHATAEQVIRDTPVEGLYVLPSGTLPPNPSELLGGPRMAEVLQQLGERFDLLLLDTPPLLAAADAAILGRQADGVLLVVRSGATERGAAQHAMQQLRTVGSHVLGVVLNDPSGKLPGYGGYYYAYSYYGEEHA